MTVRVLDGGETALPARAVALPDLPALRAEHEAFLQAGADVIRARTGTLARRRMIRAGAGAEFAAANRTACEAAVAARDGTAPLASVAGTILPLRGAGWGDGPPPDSLTEAEYAEQALLLAPYVDLIVCDGFAMAPEAAAAAKAASATGRPVWVGLALNGANPARLKGGETLREALPALFGLAEAVLVARTALPVANAAVAELAGLVPVAGVAADALEESAGEWQPGRSADEVIVRTAVPPEVFAGAAARWVDAGAQIVGGSAGATPEHIARLAALKG